MLSRKRSGKSVEATTPQSYLMIEGGLATMNTFVLPETSCLAVCSKPYNTPDWRKNTFPSFVLAGIQKWVITFVALLGVCDSVSVLEYEQKAGQKLLNWNEG